MAKVNKPQSEEDVFEVMKEYSKKKGYSFSNTQLDYMAQNCYLYFESKGWKGIAYWPAVAMRWVLNNLDKQYKVSHKPKFQGKSVKDKIIEMERENEI